MSNNMRLDKIKSIWFLPFFILGSLALYYSGWRYGIVTDFLTWLMKYERWGISGLVHCFEYPGLHHFFHLINYTTYSIIGTSRFGWYIALATGNGIAAYAVFYWFNTLGNYLNLNSASTFAFLVSLTFLLFPYNVEAVVWRACLHYLILTTLIMFALSHVLRYLVHHSYKNLVFGLGLYVLGLFTLELSFAFPLLVTALVIFHHRTSFSKDFVRDIAQVVVPAFVLLALYFLLTRIAIGSFIGHYGAEKHLSINILEIAGHAWSYFAKNLLFVHHWPFKHKEYVYEVILNKPIFVYGLSLASLILVAIVFLFLKGKAVGLKLSALKFIMFFIAIAPIVNLYFMWLLGYENDRYGYFASPFFIGGLYALIWSVKVKLLRYTIIGFYLFVCMLLMKDMLNRTKEAGAVTQSLIDSYETTSVDVETVILAIPDNYKGLYLFRDYSDDALSLVESLDFFGNKKVESKLIDIAQFNQETVADGISVTQVEPQVLHVGFNQYGNWFWKSGIGMSDYETDIFKVEVKEGYYRLTIKDNNPNRRYLYPEGGKWKVFALNTD